MACGPAFPPNEDCFNEEVDHEQNGTTISTTKIFEALEKLSTGSEAYDKTYEKAMTRIEEQTHPNHIKLGKKVIA